MLPKIILKTGKAEAVKRFHPWIFSGAIKKIEGNPDEGDVVEVFSNHNEYLATGIYQKSSIAVRIFSYKQIIPTVDFWKDKIINAYKLRKKIGLISNPHTNAYRLVFAEGDGLPGLIIDYYNGVAVIQCHSIGMHKIIDDICQILKDIYTKNLIAIYYKSKNSLPNISNLNIENKFLYGNTPEIIIKENDLNFKVEFIESQKTGFFLDQRDNRALLSLLSKGCKVLN
ncbi:MAG TPA: class I SAM-dependent rRNA methyltransferase, partial [Bacteroidales bacterium]|nr:class I SAM-dependent rRNA methyltransferase [Bacteroidales bacterium]